MQDGEDLKRVLGKGRGGHGYEQHTKGGGDNFHLSPPIAIQPLTQLRGEPIQVNPLDQVNQCVTCSNYSHDVVTIGGVAAK